MSAIPTPLDWLKKLHADLVARQRELALVNSYYVGNHPLPFLSEAHEAKIRDEFRLLLEDSRSNFMQLVVDAVDERLKATGFRLSASADKQADKGAWDIWQANQMDAEAPTALLESLIKGVSYLSVWEGKPYPTIAVEDATQTIVGYVPGSNFRQRAAALKVWRDDWTDKQRANVYLPDGIYKFEATGKDQAHASPGEAPRWTAIEKDDFVANPLGIVPIVPLRNRPRLLVEGESEITPVYHVQNQINGFLFLLAIAGYFGAHRQRWAAGVKLMEKNGKPVEPWDAAVDRTWINENPEGKFGDFAQTDLGGYIKAIEQKILHIAVITRTPRHYLIEQGQSPSGDAIKSAESGLVKKVERKQRPFGEGLEEAIRLARLFEGETDAPVDSEIVWADAATESEAVRTDAVIKQHGAGLIPTEMALEKLGYSQTEIARMMAMQAGDAMVQALLNPTPAPVATPTPAEVVA